MLNLPTLLPFRALWRGLAAALLLLLGTAHSAPASSAGACADSDTGITLSPGFYANVFADNIGHARHLVVSASGVVYVNMWSDCY